MNDEADNNENKDKIKMNFVNIKLNQSSIQAA